MTTTPTIPNIIHHIWISSNASEVTITEAPLIYRTNVNTFVTNNPTYTHKFWNINSFVNLLTTDPLLDPFKNVWYTLTTDYARYLFALYCILYAQGGIYFRLDKVNLQSLDNLLSNRTIIIVFDNIAGVDISQMGCVTSSQIMKKIIQQLVLNIGLVERNHIKYGGIMIYNVLMANSLLFNSSDGVPLSELSLYITTSQNSNSNTIIYNPVDNDSKKEEESWSNTILTILGISLIFGVGGYALVYVMRKDGKSKLNIPYNYSNMTRYGST